MTMPAATLALAATPMCVVGLTADDRPKTHPVTMENMRCQPQSLTVASGDTVVWVNKDPVPHTATSKAGGFDSQVIPAENAWRFTARKKSAFIRLRLYVSSDHDGDTPSEMTCRAAASNDGPRHLFGPPGSDQ